MKLLGYCTHCANMIGEGETECSRCSAPVEVTHSAPKPASTQSHVQSARGRNPYRRKGVSLLKEIHDRS